MSDLDPDAFGILCRNLVENALVTAQKPACGGDPDVRWQLSVANDGPVVPRDALARLTARFERGGASTDGSGLGLAIVSAIADQIESSFILSSPRPGASSGFEASIHLPIARADQSIRTIEAPR